MTEVVRRVVDAAMGSANRFGAMVRHYENLVKAAEGGASPSDGVTEGLRGELSGARRDYAAALAVLGSVLDATAVYYVRQPVEGEEHYFEISAEKTEAELEKWRTENQGKVSA